MKDELFDLSDFVDIYTVPKCRVNLVNRFIKRRKEHKLTQKELPLKAKVSYGSLKRFEQCGEISLTNLLLLADALDYLKDFDNLFKDEYITNLKDYKVY